MRILHRYIGFFMAGIMAVYSISGVLLIYRDTDFLKKETTVNTTVKPGLTEKDLGKELKMRNLEVNKNENDILYFKDGTYNITTGEASYKKKELPFVLNKFTQLHKSQSKNKLSILNVAFGVSLFFFVISSFWMFKPKSKIFKKGLIYTAIGLVFAIVLVFV